MIHRDIKPSNLLIDARDHLWVADFGLAHLPQTEHDLTRTGDLVGTLRYMSPEQAAASEGVDPRTDIYALGVTLYELLTLRPAFDASRPARVASSNPRRRAEQLRRLNSAIPRDLETIVLKAMDKEPSARYGSARELGDDLRRFLDDQPIQARRPSLAGSRGQVVPSPSNHSCRGRRGARADPRGQYWRLWEAKRRTDAALELHRKMAINAIGSVTRRSERSTSSPTPPSSLRATTNRVSM